MAEIRELMGELRDEMYLKAVIFVHYSSNSQNQGKWV